MSIESEQQEYQLKLGILHHPTLKTTQLMEFLQSQINDFLRNALPQSITQSSSQNFMANIDSLNKFEAPQQYVGVILIYNIASVQSFQYAKQCLIKLKDQQSDVFIILVQMQTGDKGDKKVNAIGNEGQKLAQKYQVHFVRLTIQNCQDLINLINKNLYELIESYYYPNEENSIQKPQNDQDAYEKYSDTYNIADHNFENQYKQGKQIYSIDKKGQYLQDQTKPINYYKKNDQSQILSDTDPIDGQQLFKIIKPQQQNISPQRGHPNKIQTGGTKTHPEQQFYLQYNQPAIKATKIQKYDARLLIQKASELRQSRNRQMLQQQRYIDESITNAQQVLNNINRHFTRKMQSGWFSQLKDSLYSPCQKNSKAYAKIKLTQQFIDDTPKKKRTNFNLSKSIFKNRMTMANKIINHKKVDTQSILTLMITVGQDYVIEFNLTQGTSIQELAKQIIGQVGIKATEKNFKIMEDKINKKIEAFTKQTERAIRNMQQKRISGRSYVKTRNIF